MVRPVWPIWKRCGRQPASTAAREAPTAAPITLASDSRMTKFSGPLSPRPPETTISASASSGRPVADSSRRSTRLHARGRACVTAGFSTVAVRPRAGRRRAGTRWAGASPSTASSPTSSSRAACPRRPGRVATSLPPSSGEDGGVGGEPRAQARGQPRHELALPRGHRRRRWPAATPCCPARPAPAPTPPPGTARTPRSRTSRRAWPPTPRAA